MSTDLHPAATPEEVEAALQRICESAPFASSERLKTFLRFVVRETLAGRADTLKEYTVGVVVYERGAAFNPKIDSIVRTEARRLRARLESYYQGTGEHDPIRIELGRGSYVPLIGRLAAPAGEPAAPETNAEVVPTELHDVADPSLRSRVTAIVLSVAMVLLTVASLALLVPAEQPPSLSFQEVDLEDPAPTGGVSRDGRYLVAHDRSGDAWRLDRQTSRTEKLTFGPDAWDGMRVPWMVPSPDGTRIAYEWMSPSSPMELRLMVPPAGTPRVLRVEPAGHTVRPVAWSGDGCSVLVVAGSRDGISSLELVSVETGATSRVATLGPVAPIGVTMTDDAAWIAYDTAPTPGPHDIMLLETRTGRVKSIVNRAADDIMPMFVNEGQALVFVSEGRRSSLWLQTLVSGAANGAPRLLKEDIEHMWAMGATRTDTLVFGILEDSSQVHVARLNGAGRVSEQPTRLAVSAVGGQVLPAWSPDGRSLVYVQQRALIVLDPGSETLVRWDRTTGTERTLRSSLISVTDPQWSPDGTRLLVRGRAIGHRTRRLHVLDARTGAILQSLPERTPEQGQLTAFGWDRSGDGIVAAVNGRGVVHIDLSTKGERVLVPISQSEGVIPQRGLAVAPDGRSVAYIVASARDGNRVASLRIAAEGRGRRELLEVHAPDWLLMGGWAPDARALLVIRMFRGRPGAGPERREVWKYNTAATASEPIGISSGLLRDLTLHPAGTAVAYVDRSPVWRLATLPLRASGGTPP